MPRPATGQVIERPTRSGPVSYAIRYRVPGHGRVFEVVGYSPAVNRRRVEDALAERLAEVRAGVWRSREAIAAERRAAHVPRMSEALDDYMAGRRADGLRPATIADLAWRLGHLRAYFVERLRDPLVSAVTVEDVDAYRRTHLAAGQLGATSINATLTALVQVLDVAAERGHVARNVARGRRRRVPATTPTRPFLEPRQVAALLDAARELDDEDRTGRRYRRALLATLALAGLRVGELLALRWADVDLADCRLTVRAAKTAAGVRVVDVQPELLDELTEYRTSARFVASGDFVFPTSTGKADNRHAVRRRVVLRAAERAGQSGTCEPLPEGLTPHALRRSFASWLIAEGEDAAYVMAQLGHTDPSMTLGLYAQALRTKKRRPHAQRTERDPLRAPAGDEATSGALTTA